MPKGPLFAGGAPPDLAIKTLFPDVALVHSGTVAVNTPEVPDICCIPFLLKPVSDNKRYGVLEPNDQEIVLEDKKFCKLTEITCLYDPLNIKFPEELKICNP